MFRWRATERDHEQQRNRIQFNQQRKLWQQVHRPVQKDLDAILDQYEFLEILGQGGMGAVFKARQKSLDRLVAVKILPAHLDDGGLSDAEGSQAGDFKFAERFQREARAMAKLSHPNIVSVYDFGQASDGQLYIVMEYVEGTDLHALIRTGELTQEHVLGWISQVCAALQYAHDQGIVHRDIKPSNIMISRDSQVKVADFGLAKVTGAGEMEGGLTMTHMTVGTPDYVAPEAMERDTLIDHRADIYAVGVMLYEMFTGKVPRGSWKPPSTRAEGLDPRYDELISRAMDADREGRFQNASDIASTLYEISTTAPPITAPQQPQLSAGTAARSTAIRAASGRVAARPVSSAVMTEGEPSAAIETKAARPMALIAGVCGAVLVIAAVAFVLLRADKNAPDPDNDVPALLTDGSDAGTSAGATTASASTPGQRDDAGLASGGGDEPSTDTDTDPGTDATTSSASEARGDPPSVAMNSPTGSADAAATPPGAASPQSKSEAEAAPDSPPATFDGKIDPPGQVTDQVDLLPLLSVNRDAMPDVEGQPPARLWKTSPDHTLTFSGPGKTGRISGPLSLAGLDDCEIEFVWQGKSTDSSGCIALDVPIDSGQWVRVKIATDGDKVSIGGKSSGLTGSPTQHSSGMRVIVRRVKSAALEVTIDGKKVAASQGKLEEIATPGLLAHRWFENEQLPVLTGINGDYKVLEWKVRTFAGELAVLEDPRLAGDARLAQLEKGFQSAFEREAIQVYTQGLDRLDKGYAGALERARKEAQQRGALDDVVAFRKEQQRIRDGVELPDSDEAAIPEALVALRATYRATRAQLETERDSKTIPLFDKYLGALAAYEAELTKDNAIEKALAIRDYRKLIVARRSEVESANQPAAEPEPEPEPEPGPGPTATAAATPPAAPKTLKPPPSGRPATRSELTDWLLTLKGRFNAIKDGASFNVRQGDRDSLPNGNFIIDLIHIESSPDTATDQDFTRLSAVRKDLVTLEIGNSPFSALPGLRDMEKLQKLAISKCPNLDSEQVLTALGSLPVLQDINFNYGGSSILTMPDNALAALSASRSLRHLKLTNIGLSDTGLAHLAATPTLIRLHVGAYQRTLDSINGSGLAAFAGHPTLTGLSLENLNPSVFDPTHLAALASTKNLNTLTITDTPIGPDGFAAIGKIGSLERLQLRAAPSIDDAALSSLATLPQLRALYFYGIIGVEGTGFAGFQCGSRLTSLEFNEGDGLSDQGLITIGATFPKLETLVMPGSSAYGIPGVEAIASLKSLTSLELRIPAEIGGKVLEPLSGNGSLTMLSVHAAEYDADAMRHLAGIRNLETLTINGAKMEPAAFAELSKARKLKDLNLRRGFMDEYLPTIRHMRNLRTLRLYDSIDRSDEARKKLIRDALPGVRVEM